MKYLTVQETCRELRCSRWTLDRRFEEGELVKVKAGRRVLIPRESVDEYIARQTQAVAEVA